MQPRLRAGLVIGAIAIASAVAGAVIDRTFLVHPPRRGGRGGGSGVSATDHEARRRAGMLDRLGRDLALTPAQRLAVDSVIQRTDSSLRVIRGEMQPRIAQVLERSRGEISARLDSAQREKFARSRAERAGRRGRRGP
ncbi:MAG: hypothetical protein JWL60_1066 [Gemmatimonadetes bacterium]|jgi:2-methylaconitate cis-trans-isomerase PrpF|nr:hypothetical protein [Gemmatimonadota bacterium]